MGSTDSPKVEAEIPNQMRPFVNDTYGRINNLNIPNVAGSPAGQAAAALGAGQFGVGGSVQNTQDYFNKLMSGSFLDPASNPHLQSVMDANLMQFQKALGGALDQNNSMFQKAGHSSSSGTAQGSAARLSADALGQFANAQGSQLFGNYQNGTQQMLAALGMGNPVANSINAAFGAANAPAMQQLTLDQIPIQQLLALLGATPLAMPKYGQSEFAQNFGMAMQGLSAGSSAYAASKK